MRFTAKEKLVSRFTRLGKKHKMMKWILLPFFCVALFLLSIPPYFISNGKKYACIIAVCIFFVMSNSFSFPIFEEMNFSEQTMLAFVEDEAPLLDEYGISVERISANVDYVSDMEIIDDEEALDEEIIDGYSNCELENMEDVDKYTLDDILEENNVVSETDEETAEVENIEEEYVFDKNDWRLLLVNKQHPVPENYTFELGTIKGAMKCDVRIIDDLLKMMKAAQEDGVNLVICSPYRDLNRQKMLFARKIKMYMSKGMSYMDAYKISSQAVTVPGASEHQLGLALDIVCDSYYSLNEGFGDTEAGKWLAEHSCEYGFTLRYPKGKEYITSIEFEPWHFRYVGREAATVMKEKGICLEEFIDSL